MASLQDIVASFTPLEIRGAEFAGKCPLEDHSELLVVMGERFRCFGCGAEGDALAFLRLMGEPDPEGALANGHDWTPTITAPAPPPSRFGLHRAALHTGVVLITDHRKAAAAAEALLPAYPFPVAWPDGGDKWGDLEPLRGRVVLLWPSNTPAAILAMQRLAAVLADPAGLGCTGKIIEPTDRPEGWNLASAQAEGIPREKLIAWAQEGHARILIPARPEADAAMPGTGVHPHPPSEPVQSPAVLEPPVDLTIAPEASGEPEAPPVADFPPEASIAPPKRRRGRLKVVGGADIDDPEPDGAPLPAEMSEDHLATAFAAQHCKDWRYVKEWDRWYQYDGDGWRPDKTELVDRLAVELCRSARYWPEAVTAKLSPADEKRIGQRRTAGQVRDMARHDRRIAATAEQWDTDPMLLGCPGGAIDLRTGKLIEGSREAYITLRTAVAPEPGEPELWLAHLNKALQGDTDTIAFLRRYLGYMLTGDVGEHCLVFFYGTGRNGKGTIVETIIKLLGDYGYAAPMNLLMESKSERHPTELAALRARRAVSASEPPEGARWDDGRIRWLTGGDTITARGMRQDLYSFQPTHKLLLMGNHTPSLRSVDEAIQARFRIIEFNYFFPAEERDTHFGDKLQAEWPRILNWMLQGCLEWQDAGLGLPERIEQATTEYLQSEDTFADWLTECTLREVGTRTKSSEAYASFKGWAEKQGEYIPSQKVFARKLKDRGYRIIKSGVKIIIDLVIKAQP